MSNPETPQATYAYRQSKIDAIFNSGGMNPAQRALFEGIAEFKYSLRLASILAKGKRFPEATECYRTAQDIFVNLQIDTSIFPVGDFSRVLERCYDILDSQGRKIQKSGATKVQVFTREQLIAEGLNRIL